MEFTIRFEFSPRSTVHRFAELFLKWSSLVYPASQTTYVGVVHFRKYTKDVTVQWTIVLVQRRFTPTTRVKTPLSAVTDINIWA